MSRFGDQLKARQPLLDRRYGDLVTIIPWLAGDMLAGGPDPATPAYELFGILDIPTKIQRVQGASGVIGSRADTLAQAAQFDFAVSALASDKGVNPTPKEGWRLQPVEPAGAPVYSIKSVEPDGLGRIVCSILKA
ncbi:hypothetical protein M2322_004807 [Rhodoblastus acidophilus]|uniref:hypothetical protein n=1 Tax=Rhodoblastus acidophilus TaxID=1074 RepID=UPI002223FF31|nr:hypothetical protein [Rhodoblastus acidophilus]MCW2319238.1 hypothetical protein [Rhodoblastus acidophilus]